MERRREADRREEIEKDSERGERELFTDANGEREKKGEIKR